MPPGRSTAPLPADPLLSVVMPVYNTPEGFLRAAVASVQRQVYPHWELCIADDASTEPHVRCVLENLAATDGRIRVEYRPHNGHIAEASNSALRLARGEFVALLDHDDALYPHALYLVAEEINAHPEVGVLYSDEDKIDEHGVRTEPYFKPDWNPDLFYSQNYPCHLGVYRRTLIEAVGGFRPGFEGAQDYDLLLRCIERIEGAQVRHIPHVLYGWRAVPGSSAHSDSAKPYAYANGERALNEHLARRGVKAVATGAGKPGFYRVRYALPQPAPLVTLIIPTRDRVDLLRPCVESVFARTHYQPFELIVVDNQSSDSQALAYLAALAERPGVRVIRYDAPFNYSALNNFAARQAQGEVLAFVNNDVEVISPEWMEELVSHALRPEVGAVGAKLYYPDGPVQHGGILLGMGGVADHAHRFLPHDEWGYFGRARLVQAFSAVTGACLVVRKDAFWRAGGFNEALTVSLNDVDLCLRLRALGLRNVWTPYAELVHRELSSRGSDDAPERRPRVVAEIAQVRAQWGTLLDNDPAYSPNLTLSGQAFTCARPTRAPKPWRAST